MRPSQMIQTYRSQIDRWQVLLAGMRWGSITRYDKRNGVTVDVTHEVIAQYEALIARNKERIAELESDSAHAATGQSPLSV